MPENAPQAWKDAVSEAAHRTLIQLNFQSQTNFSQLLGLMGLINKLGSEKFAQVFNSEAQVSQWLSGISPVSNLSNYFSKLQNLADVQNHLGLIRSVLHNSEQVALNKAQTRVLTNALLEFATNEVYTYRAEPVYRTFEAIAQRGAPGFVLLEALLVKQSEIIDRKPAKPVVDENGKKEQTTELKSRIFNINQIMISALIKGENEFSYDRFTLVLQAFCHPLTCSGGQRSLKNAFKFLQKAFTEDRLS